MISAKYRDLLHILRDKDPNWGSTGRKYGEEVSIIAKQLNAASVLDYGCGNCSLAATLDRRLSYKGYDPAVEGKNRRPTGKFDLVVAIDVLEHVEPEFTRCVLDDIYNYANLGVFLFIPTGPAKKLLPDGRNAHINQKSAWEWLELLEEYDWQDANGNITERYIQFYARKPNKVEVE